MPLGDAVGGHGPGVEEEQPDGVLDHRPVGAGLLGQRLDPGDGAVVVDADQVGGDRVVVAGGGQGEERDEERQGAGPGSATVRIWSSRWRRAEASIRSARGLR